ncbi:MAG: alpha-ribazole phosphatase family protein [Methylomonas sp.]|nr:alpha-ribazole phosphatase family protein [Methylomonas sp.]PPD20112.1 MAG: phosphoglycerate mutase [Methylomonas sp.]PPD24248.1 MAG: phosphoglycerate mutase [Methylomonas sp.]PPD32856.1 MAG: phosphoglycerate mutase [Methylomonas sp.]PPD37926.1 MAG: phosphoglycerate mutase [Methylomonas sp.]
MATVTTVIDLLRHGKTVGGQRFRGRTDDALTPTGWQQMQTQCQHEHWDAVISSPLQRCERFASQLGERMVVSVLIDTAWQEIDFGCWEGLTADAIEQSESGALQRYYDNPEAFTPDGGEPYPAFFQRVTAAWQQVCQDHRGRRILIVSHAGVIRAVFAHVLQLSVRQSFQIALPHACLTRFTCFDDEHGHGFTQLSLHRPLSC